MGKIIGGIRTFLVFFLMQNSLICMAEEWNFDDDWGCCLFGCVTVNYGEQSQIYLLDTGPGSRAGLYLGMPELQTRDAGYSTGLSGNGGMLIGFDLSGDDIAEISVQDTNASGFLDTGDQVGKVPMTQNTRVVLLSREIRRSFYLNSNAAFAVTACIVRNEGWGEMGNKLKNGDISYQVGFLPSDAESGISRPDFMTFPASDNLNTLGTAPKSVAVFDQAIKKDKTAGFMQSALCMTNHYCFPRYDLSMGTGGARIGIRYEIFCR